MDPPEPGALPPPPAPPGEVLSAEAEPRRSRRWLVAAVVGATVGIVALVVVVLAFSGHRSPRFPEEFAGQPRAHGPNAQRAESATAGTEVMGVSFDMALYGPDEHPTTILMIFKGLPDIQDDAFFDSLSDGFSRGFAASSGLTIDASTQVRETRNGVDYTCSSVTTSSEPSAQAAGVICLFRGDVTGALFSADTTDPSGALDLSEQAHEALAG